MASDYNCVVEGSETIGNFNKFRDIPPFGPSFVKKESSMKQFYSKRMPLTTRRGANPPEILKMATESGRFGQEALFMTSVGKRQPKSSCWIRDS
jgi:hypothetical protein